MINEKRKKHPTISSTADNIINESYFSHSELLEMDASFIATSNFLLKDKLKMYEKAQKDCKKKKKIIDKIYDDELEEYENEIIKIKNDLEKYSVCDTKEFQKAVEDLEGALKVNKDKRKNKWNIPRIKMRVAEGLAKRANVNIRILIANVDSSLLNELEHVPELRDIISKKK